MEEKTMKTTETKASFDDLPQMKKTLKEACDFMKSGEYKKAIDLFCSAIEVNPSDARLYINRSYCWEQLAQYKHAVDDAVVAIQLDPNRIGGYYRKGCVDLIMGRFRSAEKAFLNALKLNECDVDTKQKLEETLQQFAKMCGFDESVAQKYGTCEAFSEAIISGDLVEGPFESQNCTEMYRMVPDEMVPDETIPDETIPDEADLQRSVSIENELNFDPDDMEDDTNVAPDVISLAEAIAIDSRNSDLIGWRTPDYSQQSRFTQSNPSSIIRAPNTTPSYGTKSFNNKLQYSSSDLNSSHTSSNTSLNSIPLWQNGSDAKTGITMQLNGADGVSFSSTDSSPTRKFVKTRRSIIRSVLNVD